MLWCGVEVLYIYGVLCGISCFFDVDDPVNS